ncbi:MAG: hypothetical protein FD146_2511 [Anaerolineaceae bacterium]|nr:MAG: hypothetical protein FD146_2511 [Anaerolineaceae bacterium]
MTKKRTHVVLIVGIIVLVCGCCLAPLPVPCGAPGMSCRTGPGPGGASSVFYELEPLGVAVLELVFQDNIRIYYWTWDSSD